MRRRFLLIANPAAGLATSTLLEATCARLRAEGAHAVEVRPPSIEAAREEAQRASCSGAFDAVVAAGGDGTIRQVAAGLVGTPMPLGIIPAGTANVLAIEIGLATRPAAIVDALLHGPATRMVCARANGELFLLMAGAGLDARVLGLISQRLKSRLGKAAFAGPIVDALTHPVDRLTVTVDGVKHEASWVILANAAHYAGNFVLAPAAAIGAPDLQAIIFKGRTRATLMGQIMSLAIRPLRTRAARDGDVVITPCRRAIVTALNPVPTQLDGDVFGTTPLSVEAATDTLQLILPARPA